MLGIADVFALQLSHQGLHINKTLFGFAQKLTRRSHDHRIGSHRDRAAFLLRQVIHAGPEPLRVGIEDFVIANHLQSLVSLDWLPERCLKIASELGFLITKLSQIKLLLITRSSPDHHFDFRTRSGNCQRGIVQGHLEFLAGNDGFLTT